MTNAINMTISSFETMQHTSGEAVDISGLQHARDELAKVEIGFDEIGNEINKSTESQKQLNREIEDGNKFTNGLKNSFIGMAAAYLTMRSGQKVLDLSDTLINTTARLNLMNDGLQTTKELQDMIYQSAERSRTSYMMTADVVSKIGMNAKDAFGSNVELVNFAEQLNKSLVIAGADGMAAESTIYNLTQALSTGVLRGQDLNAVLSNSPNIVQNIADYLEVPLGTIREMAADGEITANIVKNAMLSATDATNKAFESMPKTFGQIWTSMGNHALMAFDPVLKKINEIGNSERFQTTITVMTNSFVLLAEVALWGVDIVTGGIQLIADNLDFIIPIILMYVAVWAIVNAELLLNASVSLYMIGRNALLHAQTIITTGGLMLQATATFFLTWATMGLNAALLASPIGWVIGGIIIIVGAIFLAVAAFNKLAGTSGSAMGIIGGVIGVTAAFIGNILLALVGQIWSWGAMLYNGVISLAEFFANVFTQPVSAIGNLFADLGQYILSIMLMIANTMDTIFGSNLSETVNGWKGSLKEWSDATFEKKKVEFERVDVNSPFERFDYGDAWDSGYNMGENIGQGMSDMFNPEVPEFAMPEFDLNGLGGINDTLGDIGKDTKGINDKMKITEEDIKYLRDITGQRIMDRLTSSEFKVEITNHNNIDSQMDLDGVINDMADGLEEQFNIAMEGGL